VARHTERQNGVRDFMPFVDKKGSHFAHVRQQMCRIEIFLITYLFVVRGYLGLSADCEKLDIFSVCARVMCNFGC